MTTDSKEEFVFARSGGLLVLLSGYQAPEAIRRMTESRLTAWPAKRGMRRAATIAEKEVTTGLASKNVSGGRRCAAGARRDSGPTSG
ncbi:hypothetical protein [Streptomyces sp. NPDC127118]|uniref:hypothetical protein n=1 Tax=Streptomyces sp. NPDC127118 TaxID=3345369 RepID=UPI00363C67AC